MSEDWESHVAILEAPPPANPQELDPWLRRRQRALDALAALTPDALAPEKKQRLRFRLEAVRAKDLDVIDQIRSHQDGLRERIQTSTQGRVALRGYQSPPAARVRTRGRQI